QYHVLIQGRPLEAIISVAAEEGVDLIVMGTKGASGLKEVFFGSVTGEVMEHAPAPVLAVPEEASFDGRFDRIAVTTEFAEEEKKALYKVLEFASWFDDPKISVIHVDVGHTESIAHKMDAFKKEFEGKPNLEFVVIDATTIEKGLQMYLEAHKVDILCMLTHKRGVLEELFNYSVAKKMAYHLTTPILAIQASLLQ
ncbi:MAG: universal stress protein, partial [Bacteroidetes bacterium]